MRYRERLWVPWWWWPIGIGLSTVLAAQVNARLLRIAPWQLELLVYGYQVGSLVVPTLAPILVWLWLDRQFVAKVVVPAWKPSAPASPAAADPS